MTESWVGFLGGPWGFAFAFAAGVLSFLWPCCLPLVPAYLAHLHGTTATLDRSRSERRETVTHAASFRYRSVERCGGRLIALNSFR